MKRLFIISLLLLLTPLALIRGYQREGKNSSSFGERSAEYNAAAAESKQQDIHLENLDTEIEFNGEKKPIMVWLDGALIRDGKEPFSSFSVTSNIEYKDGNFTKKGDIYSLSTEDLDKIENGHAVYCLYYSVEKTRISRENYQEVGAIITGTRDCNKCFDLHFDTIFTCMKRHNEKIEKLNEDNQAK